MRLKLKGGSLISNFNEDIIKSLSQGITIEEIRMAALSFYNTPNKYISNDERQEKKDTGI